MEQPENNFSAREEIRTLIEVLIQDGLDALGYARISLELRSWLIERIPNGKCLLAVAVASCEGTELEQPLADKIYSIPKLALNHGLTSRLKLLKSSGANNDTEGAA